MARGRINYKNGYWYSKKGRRMALVKKMRLPSDTFVLCGLACVIPSLAPLAPLQISSAAVLAAFYVCLLRPINEKGWFLKRTTSIIIIILLTAWAAISSIWSIDGLHSLSSAFRLLLAATTLIILCETANRLKFSEQGLLLKCMAYGAIAGITITILSIGAIHLHTIWVQKTEVTDHELRFLNRNASVIVIFLWPWSLAILKTLGRPATFAFVVLATISLLLLAPSAPLLALCCASLAFLVAWHSPTLAKFTLGSVYLCSVIAIPYLSSMAPHAVSILSEHLANPASIVHRLMIWQFSSEQILENPILGWGLNTARILPGGGEEIVIGTADHPVDPDAPILGQALPLHPHNALIQIWLELGLVGLILFSMLFFLILTAIPGAKEQRLACCISISGLTAGFVISQLGFGFWQGWWLATLGIAAVLTQACTRTAMNPTT